MLLIFVFCLAIVSSQPEASQEQGELLKEGLGQVHVIPYDPTLDLMVRQMVGERVKYAKKVV
jgi:hypothetical protein